MTSEQKGEWGVYKYPKFADKQYRVTLVVEYLGRVDLDLGPLQ